MSEADIAAVRDIVLEAGRLAMSFFRGGHNRWEKGPGQIVTDADIAVDRFLKAELLRRWPADGWLSEESADDGTRLTNHRVWIVDPIDGTRSFAEGVAEFTVCVGLLIEGVPVLGFVLNPATGELFEAAAGCGAWLSGQPIVAAATDGLNGASVVVSRSENRRRNFPGLLPGARVETIGSLALKLCLVAAGRYDGYVTWRPTHDWDIAAAVLILAEAGAVASDPTGAPIGFTTAAPVRRGLVAAPAALHPTLVAAVRSAYLEAVA